MTFLSKLEIIYVVDKTSANIVKYTSKLWQTNCTCMLIQNSLSEGVYVACYTWNYEQNIDLRWLFETWFICRFQNRVVSTSRKNEWRLNRDDDLYYRNDICRVVYKTHTPGRWFFLEANGRFFFTIDLSCFNFNVKIEERIGCLDSNILHLPKCMCKINII